MMAGNCGDSCSLVAFHFTVANNKSKAIYTDEGSQFVYNNFAYSSELRGSC